MTTEYNPTVPAFSFGQKPRQDNDPNTYEPTMPPVDFRLLAQIAKRTGRIQGQADYFAGEIKRQDNIAEILDAARKAFVEEEKARTKNKDVITAAADLISGKNAEVNNPGFLSSMGDAALHGLNTTIDVLSTPLYGIANTAKQAVEDSADKLKDVNFLSAVEGIAGMVTMTADPTNPQTAVNMYEASKLPKAAWSLAPDSGQEVQNLLGAGWDGVTWKEKTTFADVFETQDMLDGKKDNNNLKQAGFGLVFDIAFDPTTYIGVGLVRKGIEVGIDGTKAGLAQRAVNRVTGATKTHRTAELINESDDAARQELVDKIVSLNVHRDVFDYKTGEVNTIIMGDKEVKNMLGAWAGLADRVNLKGADRVAKIRETIEADLKAVRDAIDESPHSDFAAPVTDALDEQLAKLKAGEHDLVKELDEFSKKALNDELERAAKLGKYPEYPSGTIKTTEVTENLNLGVLTKLAEGFRKMHSKGASTKHYDEGKSIFDKAAGSWFHNENLVDQGVVKNLLSGAVAAARSKYGDEIGVLQAQQKSDRELLPLLKNDAEKAETLGKMQARQTKMANLFAKIDDEVAKAVSAHLSNHMATQQINKGLSPRYNEIQAELERIDEEMLRIEMGPSRSLDPEIAINDGEEINAKWMDQLDEEGNLIYKPEYKDALTDLTNQRAALQKEMKQVRDNLEQQHAFRTSTRTITAESNPEEFAAVMQDRIEQETIAVYDKLVATEARKQHLGGSDLKVELASFGESDKAPRITFNGRHVTYQEFRDLPDAEKAHLFTPELVEAVKAEQTRVDRFIKEGKEARLSSAWKHVSNSKIRKKAVSDAYTYERLFGKHVIWEQIAFERLFKEQFTQALEETNLSLRRYAQLVSDTTNDDMIRRVPFGDEDLTLRQYTDRRKANPAQHLGPDDSIPVKGGKRITLREWEAAGNPRAQFVSEYRKWATEKPVAFEASLKKIFMDKAAKVHGFKAAGRGTSTVKNIAKGTGLTKAKRNELKSKAYEIAVSKWKDKKQLVVNKVDNPDIPLTSSVEKVSFTAKEEAQIALRHNTETAAEEVAAAKIQLKKDGNKAKHAETLRKIAEVKAARAKAIVEAEVQARKTKEAFKKEIEQQTLLNIINNTVQPGRRVLRISAVGGRFLDVPSPEGLSRAVEKLAGVPMIRAGRESWGKAFIASSKLEPDMNVARLRMQNHTPGLIKYHTDEIRKNFAKFTPSERVDSLKHFRNGGAVRHELDQHMHDFFNNYVKYVNESMEIGEEGTMEILTVMDINRYLPDRFKMSPLRGEKYMRFHDGRDIVKHMQHLRDSHDPMELMWRMAIACEQSQAKLALQSVVKKLYGIRRGGINDDVIEQLRTDHGWETSRQLGDEHLFPPELKDQVDKLFSMLEPVKMEGMVRTFDKVMNIWKSAVTVYNIPGFYMRNGLGEFLMGMFDNVLNPVHYSKAIRLLLYKTPDEVKDSLRQLKPWQAHQSKAAEGGRRLTKLKNGPHLSVEETLILYHDQGLHTGFVSTEWDQYAPGMGSTFRAKTGMTKINETVRRNAERFEDFFRMAHFISRLERSNKGNPLEAAKEAAGYVRKFHFDYTDFTPFEKGSMVRLFPFYKWNRKSVPMMAGMLFTHPGKMLLYPKTLQNMSYATGATDPLEDRNGFQPNYEGVVPSWMKDMMAYPIGGQVGSGDDVYFNVSTPQFDAMKAMNNPIDFIKQLTTPALKVPIELASGARVFTDTDWKMKSTKDKMDYLKTLTPQGSKISDLIDKLNSGTPQAKRDMLDNPKFLSWLTGTGFYANTESRQQGEIYRQSQGSN